jgi:hypothetical protein
MVAVAEETLHFAFEDDAATSVEVVVYSLSSYLDWRCFREHIMAQLLRWRLIKLLPEQDLLRPRLQIAPMTA